MQERLSHAKSMEKPSLREQPVIANTEDNFFPINKSLDVTKNIFEPIKRIGY